MNHGHQLYFVANTIRSDNLADGLHVLFGKSLRPEVLLLLLELAPNLRSATAGFIAYLGYNMLEIAASN